MKPKKKARKITSECEWKKSLQRVLRVYKGDGIKKCGAKSSSKHQGAVHCHIQICSKHEDKMLPFNSIAHLFICTSQKHEHMEIEKEFLKM